MAALSRTAWSSSTTTCSAALNRRCSLWSRFHPSPFRRCRWCCGCEWLCREGAMMSVVSVHGRTSSSRYSAHGGWQWRCRTLQRYKNQALFDSVLLLHNCYFCYRFGSSSQDACFSAFKTKHALTARGSACRCGRRGLAGYGAQARCRWKPGIVSPFSRIRGS